MADEQTFRFVFEEEGGDGAAAAPGEEGGVRPDIRQNPRTTRREASEAARGGAGPIAQQAQAAKALETNARDGAKQATKLAQGERAALQQAAVSLASRAGLGGPVGRGFAAAAGAAGPIAVALAGAAAIPIVAERADAFIRGRADTLADVSPALAQQRAQNEVLEIQRRIQSAQQVAPDLAEFERNRESLSRATRTLQDQLSAFGAREFNKAIEGQLPAPGILGLPLSLTGAFLGRGFKKIADYFNDEDDRNNSGRTLTQFFEERPFLEPDSPPGVRLIEEGQPRDAPLQGVPQGAGPFVGLNFD